MIGQTISHYRILEKIGAGGRGEVYLAVDTFLERKVALKFLPEHLYEGDLARKRFLREGQSEASSGPELSGRLWMVAGLKFSPLCSVPRQIANTP